MRVIKWIPIVLATIVVIGVLYEQLSRLYFNRKKPGAESFRTVKGSDVHFVRKGSGSPTVVFDFIRLST